MAGTGYGPIPSFREIKSAAAQHFGTPASGIAARRTVLPIRAGARDKNLPGARDARHPGAGIAPPEPDDVRGFSGSPRRHRETASLPNPTRDPPDLSTSSPSRVGSGLRPSVRTRTAIDRARNSRAPRDVEQGGGEPIWSRLLHPRLGVAAEAHAPPTRTGFGTHAIDRARPEI